MKKLIVAMAALVFATSASAVISGSRHDFISNGYVTPAPTSACVFCHTPHQAASSLAPIWARSLTAPTTLYTSTTVNAITNTASIPAGIDTCLGCHATGTAASMGTTNAITDTTKITGTDLSNDHPVGNDTIFGSPSLKASASISLGGVTFADGATLSCAGCHDVHNTTATGAGLLRAFTGDFCNACHNK